jgi:hypothetical protein
MSNLWSISLIRYYTARMKWQQYMSSFNKDANTNANFYLVLCKKKHPSDNKYFSYILSISIFRFRHFYIWPKFRESILTIIVRFTNTVWLLTRLFNSSRKQKKQEFFFRFFYHISLIEEKHWLRSVPVVDTFLSEVLHIFFYFENIKRRHENMSVNTTAYDPSIGKK